MLRLNSENIVGSTRGVSAVELLVVLLVIVIAVAIATPWLMRSDDVRPSLTQSVALANEAGAVRILRALSSAERAYFSVNNKYGTLDQLKSAGYLDSTFGGPSFTRGGYTFNHSLTPSADSFCVDAVAQSGADHRVFGLDRSGLILAGLTDTRPCENGLLDTTGGSPVG